MNKSNAHLYLPLVQALAEGKTIQYAENPNREGSWSDSGEVHLGHPPDRYRIKPLPFPPIPDGMTYHNPDGLTAEQVGDGYRLMLSSESTAQDHEMWRLSSKTWQSAIRGDEPASSYYSTYRVPIFTPYPDGSRIVDGKLVKPEPKEKFYAVYEDLQPSPEPPKLVPLGPSDVPPGSAIRDKSEPTIWRAITAVDSTRVFQSNSVRPSITFQELLDEEKEILRPGQTDWQSCSKTS